MYLSDTHPFVYHLQRKFSRLGKRARHLFQNADEGQGVIYVPSIVLWEIGRPHGLLDPAEKFALWCRRLNDSPGYAIEPLEWQDVNEARTLPFRDPADCLIVGTAIRLGIPLITKDQEIADSGIVETIW